MPEMNHFWPLPTPLTEGLPPVAKFDYELLPNNLRTRVADISERMQCPSDFVAVGLLAVLSAAIGRRCGISPKASDDWIVVPNLWAAVIGRPGLLKTPALEEIMRPLKMLQAKAIEQFDRANADYQSGELLAEQAERVGKDEIKKLLKAGKTADAADRADELVGRRKEKPTCARYIVNDATVEKLGELLNENPAGLLLFRDELVGFFRTLERQGHEADRAFYLECWNGSGSFTYDRIGRGTLHINGACLSILGGIQPGPLAELVRDARGNGDDGLVQRFQLAVFPDADRSWRNVDRAPDVAARDRVQAIIERLQAMTAGQLGADPGAVPVLRFDPDAQQLFDGWREALEVRLRSDIELPTMEAHLAKYRSLVPSIALILHLAEHQSGDVELQPLTRAIAWAEYLESHARRIYAPALSGDIHSARALALRLKAGELGSRFALRDVYRKGWTALGTHADALAAVTVLIELDWLRAEQEQTTGRTATTYTVNPSIVSEAKQP
jgi:putative DNA primase/helicase